MSADCQDNLCSNGVSEAVPPASSSKGVEERPTAKAPLTPEEFRAVYVSAMRAKYEEARQRRAAGLPLNPHVSPQPQESQAAIPPLYNPARLDRAAMPRNAGHADVPLRDGGGVLRMAAAFLPNAIGMAFQVALAAFVFTQGDTGAPFWRFFVVLLVVKLASVLLGKLRLQRRRHDSDNDVRAEEHRVQLTGHRKLWYITWKSAVTFFVSLTPSFRVEALEVELKMDGIDHSGQRGPPAAGQLPADVIAQQ